MWLKEIERGAVKRATDHRGGSRRWARNRSGRGSISGRDQDAGRGVFRNERPMEIKEMGSLIQKHFGHRPEPHNV